MARFTLAVAFLSCPFLASCAAPQPEVPAPAAATAPAGAGSAAASPGAPDPAAAPAEPDPKITALAKPALECKYVDDGFDPECAALKAWTGNEELFAEGKGNPTLLSMLEDPELKTRRLVGTRGMPDAQTFFASKGNAVRLFAAAKKETNPRMAEDLGGLVAIVDAEKLGLAAELRALAKHPVASFREALAFYLVVRHQTPLNLEIAASLMEDSERRVRENAVGSLSSGGATPATEPVCKLLSKQLARTDDLVAKALWAAGSSKCKGILNEVTATLFARTADPTKVANEVGIGYTLAIGSVCSNPDAPPDVKAKVFTVAQKLTDAAVPDPNTRVAAIGALVGCDRQGSEKVVVALTKDKDKAVAVRANKELEEIKKAASKSKPQPKKK